MENWLSPSEAALKIHVSGQYIRKIMREGKVKYIWTSLGRLVDPESLDAFQAARVIRKPSARQDATV